jgi:hypothetical protein
MEKDNDEVDLGKKGEYFQQIKSKISFLQAQLIPA